MKNTIGIFLITKSDKVLICHPTYDKDDNWSIPKGLKEDHESDWTAGIRELYEETDIKYDDIVSNVQTIARLSDVKYKNGKKKLTPYFIKLKNDDILKQKLLCKSMINIKGREPFPEVDRFKWVEFDEALKLIHVTQKIALEEYINNWK